MTIIIMSSEAGAFSARRDQSLEYLAVCGRKR